MIKTPKVVLSFAVKKDAKGVVLNPEVLSKTVQSEKDTVDINRIMKNHEKHGGLIGNPFLKPIYGDFTQFGDYREIKTRAAVAEQTFQLLPPDVRNMFDNDPQKLYEFLADSKNDEKAVEFGLKHADVLKTELADDGKTRITKSERKKLDDKKVEGEKAAEHAKKVTEGTSGTRASGTEKSS